jgi:hypothetical protein
VGVILGVTAAALSGQDILRGAEIGAIGGALVVLALEEESSDLTSQARGRLRRTLLPLAATLDKKQWRAP